MFISAVTSIPLHCPIHLIQGLQDTFIDWRVVLKLADKMEQKLVAVVIGGNVESVANEAIAYGADEVLLVEGEEYYNYTTDAYAHAMETLACKYKPSIILLGATRNGRDFGPHVACNLQTGLSADCTSMDYDKENGNIVWTRPAYGGDLMAAILCADHRPQMGTIRPGVFKKPVKNRDRTGLIIREEIHIAKEEIRLKKWYSILKPGNPKNTS